MVDRLEELLALLEEEKEEEQEDVLMLKPEAEDPVPPVPEAGMEEILGDSERELGPALEEEAGGPEWMPDISTALPERPDEILDVGEAGAVTAGDEAAEALWDELRPAAAVPNGTAVLKRPEAGYVGMTELAGAAEKTAAANEPDAVAGIVKTAEEGLEGLYRRTVQSGRPVAQTLPAEQAGQTVRAEEPGRSAALTVDELDRAVRRDSRRYDGGMTIF